jgi:hypothetical protein
MMNNRFQKILLWAPRILGVVFALFLSLFAFDVFGMGGGFWEKIGAFLLHLIPTALVLVAAALGWRWQWAGGLLFVALSGLYIVATYERAHWSWYILVAGPLFVIGILFLAGWVVRTRSFQHLGTQ